jgi:hypothetical protein
LLTTTASYLMVTRDIETSLARASATPRVERERAYYLANIGNVKSIDDFLADDRLYRFAMQAFGLADMAYAKAFMRKVLEDGVASADSFANKLTDKRYAEFAKVFDFASFGEATTAFDAAQQGAVDRYIRQTLEESAGAENEGVRLALYFSRKAESVTSAYSILADPALLKVVQTILRIPPETSAMDIDKQAALIASRLDIDELKEPTNVERLLARFTALWELDNPGAGRAAAAPTILVSPPQEIGIGAEILMSLQNLKPGGF